MLFKIAAVVLIVAFIVEQFRAAKRKRLEAERAEKKAKAEAAYERKVEEIRKFYEEHDDIETKIAGVTFDNEDGTSRQKALQGALADGCTGDISLLPYEYNGEDAVLVKYDGVGIGNIPREHVDEVIEVMDRITSAELSVEEFVTDAGNVIYRADIRLVYKLWA